MASGKPLAFHHPGFASKEKPIFAAAISGWDPPQLTCAYPSFDCERHVVNGVHLSSRTTVRTPEASI